MTTAPRAGPAPRPQPAAASRWTHGPPLVQGMLRRATYSRRMRARLARGLAVAAAVVALVVPGSVASAADEIPDGAPVGYDVSYPQCARELPEPAEFAVVGVNGGTAVTTNPCFRSQLDWARGATGGTGQPPVALYVNTANPGHDGSWWPTSNTYPAGARTSVPNPYGVCRGEEDAACAYVYGYAKAHDSAWERGVPKPATYMWWLDVETMNTWQPDRVANRAVLEGMAYYLLEVLEAEGVGVYSTSYQWTQIVGRVGPVRQSSPARASILNGLPSWLAGATSLETARRACGFASLTGGDVALVQWVQDDLDHNYACSAE